MKDIPGIIKYILYYMYIAAVLCHLYYLKFVIQNII